MVNTNLLHWQKLRDNVQCKPLARDEKRDFQIDIIKLKKNFTYPTHAHKDIEWVYVLKGSCKDEHGSYQVGDFFVNNKDSEHTVEVGEEGVELLVCWCGSLKNSRKRMD